MPRKVILDERILSYFAEWSTQARVTCGLMIGQSNRFRDFIVHCPRTPLNVPIRRLEELDSQALNKHASKVLVTLPGGFLVLGVFFMCPEAVFDKTLAIIGEVLQVITKNKELCGSPPRNRLLLLHMNSRTKQAGCAEVCLTDTGEPKVKQADHTFACLSTDWIAGKYSWDEGEADKGTDQPGDPHHWDVMEKLSEGLINCRLLINDERVENETAKLKSKIKNGEKIVVPFKGTKQDVEVMIQFEIRICDDDRVLRKSNSEKSNSALTSDLIFMHQDATLSEAFQAAKDDLLRSFAVKCDVLQESGANGDSRSGARPRRLLLLTSDLKVPFSYYLCSNEMLDINRLASIMKEDLALSPNEPQFMFDPLLNQGLPLKTKTLETEENKQIPKLMIFTAGLMAVFSAIYFCLF